MRQGILLLLLCFFLPEQAMPFFKQKVKHSMNPFIANERRFGDCGNRGFIPFSVRLEGKILWPNDSIAMSKTCRGSPRNLGLSNNFLVVDCGSELEVLDKNTGTVQWNRAKFDNAEFDLNEKGIVTLNHAGYYELLDMKGVLVESMPLPECADNAQLIFFSGSQEDSYYCVNYFGSKYVSPGKNAASVDFSFVHTATKRHTNVWSYVKREELAKWICRSSDGSTIHIASDRALYAIPVNAEHDEQVKMTPFIRIEGLSLLQNDELLVIEKTEKSRFLHQIHPATGKKNSLELPASGDIVQPAASSPDGAIFLAIGSTLFCFKMGQELWRHRFETALQPLFITVLGDNSVLSVSGHYIFQTQSDGVEMFEKFCIPEITCRPIADAEGHVFIGGKGGVVCLQ